MSGILKYVMFSVAFHTLAAAAVLGMVVYPGSVRDTGCLEVVRLATVVEPVVTTDGTSMNRSYSTGKTSKIADDKPTSAVVAHKADAPHIERAVTPLRYNLPSIAPDTVAYSGNGSENGTACPSAVSGLTENPGEGESGGGTNGGAGNAVCGFGESGGPGIIELAMPDYPERAMRRGKGGAVVLRLVIGEDGSVGSVNVMEPAGFGLDEAAVRAAMNSRFSPAVRNGRPVECVALLPYRFEPLSR